MILLNAFLVLIIAPVAVIAVGVIWRWLGRKLLASLLGR